MSEKIPVIPNQWVQAPASDEIDLRELVLVLWRQKTLILLVSSLFAVAGIAYALLSPQVWSAKAVISEPRSEDLRPLLRMASQATQFGITNFPTGQDLYGEFIAEFNSYDNRRDFLKGSSFFKEQVQAAQLNQRDQRLWLRKWSELISANAVDKKGGGGDIIITSSADNSSQALNLLEAYIQFIIEKQQHDLLNNLAEQQSTNIEALGTQVKLMREDAERAFKNEINNLVLTISIAKAAGVERPLTNYSNGDRFSLTLGTKGLEEKLKVLRTLDLTAYQPRLIELQVQMDRLKAMKIEGVSFRPFSYLDAPEEPLSRDKPKRPLIVVLATLLGGMLGVAIVLVRHAFRRPEQV
ncbi:LPS O-antigen chain length determinant protein WzzB [Aeromonas veronii]|uniref:LPS O-antigen chain length determinant protein WzzB n=1 Tax=Aeromonas veronii TaxID=654 RepID=UPI001EEEA64F|nr:Wzz/FepE/Etk N-terminal domain-containing protein [Aeromonas veronii]